MVIQLMGLCPLLLCHLSSRHRCPLRWRRNVNEYPRSLHAHRRHNRLSHEPRRRHRSNWAHHPHGSIYVVYKIDGNSLGNGGSCNNGIPPIHSTPIMLQKMAGDGYTPVGSAVQILDHDAGDGPLVEARSLIYVDGVFFLFFSSGCFSDTSYDLSYATATAVTGPYTKAGAPSAPLLTAGKYGLRAPGSACFAQDGSKVVLHAYLGADISGGRGMWTGIPTFSGATVTL
ncbi:glycosyl hydrolase [Mycena sp. CBHHK59/15]|nr:glycosyl hydrolase [Mycena sp. CBHHK59/15]